MRKSDSYRRHCSDCNLDFSHLELDIDGNCPKCHLPCMIRWPKKDLPQNWPYNDPVIYLVQSGPTFPAHHPAWSGKVSTEGRPFDPKTIFAAIESIKASEPECLIDGIPGPEHVYHHAYLHLHAIPHKHEDE